MLIDVDLRHCSTYELIDELENRYLDQREMSSLLDLVKGDDSQKLKLFISVMDKYSSMELQDIFKEDLKVTEVPKEQMCFDFECTPQPA